MKYQSISLLIENLLSHTGSYRRLSLLTGFRRETLAFWHKGLQRPHPANVEALYGVLIAFERGMPVSPVAPAAKRRAARATA